ncbi:hypothetical protein ACA910_006094 [Epithemia clementina (nom. ined.)]
MQEQRFLDSADIRDSRSYCDQDEAEGEGQGRKPNNEIDLPAAKPRNRFSLLTKREKAHWAATRQQQQQGQQQHFNQMESPPKVNSSDDWLESLIQPEEDRAASAGNFDGDEDNLTWTVHKNGFTQMVSHRWHERCPKPEQSAFDDGPALLGIQKSKEITSGGAPPACPTQRSSSSSSVSGCFLEDDTWAQATLATTTTTKKLNSPEKAQKQPEHHVSVASLATGFWISKKTASPAFRPQSPVQEIGGDMDRDAACDSGRLGISPRHAKFKTTSTLATPKTELTSRYNTTVRTTSIKADHEDSPRNQGVAEQSRNNNDSAHRDAYALQPEGATLDHLLRELSWSSSSKSMSEGGNGWAQHGWNGEDFQTTTSLMPMQVFVSSYFGKPSGDGDDDEEEEDQSPENIGVDNPLVPEGGVRGQHQDQLESPEPAETEAEIELIQGARLVFEDKNESVPTIRHPTRKHKTTKSRRSFLLRMMKFKTTHKRETTECLVVATSNSTDSDTNIFPLEEVVVRRMPADDDCNSFPDAGYDEYDTCSAVTDPDYGIGDEYSFAGSDYSASTVDFLFMDK